jgi:hypothetical protein
MISTALLAATVLAAAGPATPAPGKLPAAVAREMTEAIVAVNKALGLESWPMHGAKPCVDRGGQGITAKDVSADDTRKCAGSAIDKGFPEVGRSYLLAIPMADVGPATVIAFGIGESAGWSAYSCDPERRCLPVKLSAPTKWGKRMAERQAAACAAPTTLWFPTDKRACPTSAPGATPTSPPAPAPTSPPARAPTPAK